MTTEEVFFKVYVVCPVCNGTKDVTYKDALGPGLGISDRCYECMGTGKVERFMSIEDLMDVSIKVQVRQI